MKIAEAECAYHPPRFDQVLREHGIEELRASGTIHTLQVNVGKRCNQACKHCHVDAGPNRTEVMTRETVEQVIEAVRRFRIATVDITGGAPELNPCFRHLVEECRGAGSHVVVRHNLTVQFTAGQECLPGFFRAQGVELTCSLPYFLAQQTDAQRGKGVFDQSIEALRRLNAVGYGGGELLLNLVYNPVGAFLPPQQSAVEADFKRELKSRYDIVFDRLYTITNMPINRFLDFLQRTNNYQRYMERLVQSFNPATVDGLMCRTLVSVDWTGKLHDCDFNQMLHLTVEPSSPQTIADFDPAKLAKRRILTREHCFGCTAGAGSSCGGVISQ